MMKTLTKQLNQEREARKKLEKEFLALQNMSNKVKEKQWEHSQLMMN